MMDEGTPPDRNRYLPTVQAVDDILSRGSFIPALKAIVADQTGKPAWRRVLPSMAEWSPADERRLLADFRGLVDSCSRGSASPDAIGPARFGSLAGR